MSKRNARAAGITFLLYYATALSEMFLYRKASSGEGIAPKLASIAQHAPQVRLTVVFAILTILYALVLAVTLYALTRDVDRDVALLAFACRLFEAVMNAVPATARLGLLSIATTGANAAAAEAVALQAQAGLLFKISDWSATASGTVFAVGSTLFAYLFLRGRSISAAIAWLGLIGSLMVVPVFSLRALRLVSGAAVWLTSIPLIVFEITLALWLLIRGVATPQPGAQP